LWPSCRRASQAAEAAVDQPDRGVVLEGSSLAGVSGEPAILAVWTLVPFAVALRLFKWH
jgi:hypothetical protein